jgi:hypothetical protein
MTHRELSTCPPREGPSRGVGSRARKRSDETHDPRNARSPDTDPVLLSNRSCPVGRGPSPRTIVKTVAAKDFSDVGRIEGEEAFNPLREDARFRQLLDEIKKNQPGS